jgi:hypothetical protein
VSLITIFIVALAGTMLIGRSPDDLEDSDDSEFKGYAETIVVLTNVVFLLIFAMLFVGAYSNFCKRSFGGNDQNNQLALKKL